MKAIQVLILSLAIIISLNSLTYGQNLKGKDKKEFKERCKLFTKQGYEADPAYGTCPDQNEALLKLQNENELRAKENKEDKWVIETVDFFSGDKGIAQDKARDFARNTLGKNLGSFFKGKIELGQHYSTETGEDITPELKDATGAFDEVFGKELDKNKIVQRFEKKEKNGWTIKLTIALNYDMLLSDVQDLSKNEIRDRIEKIRKEIKKE